MFIRSFFVALFFWLLGSHERRVQAFFKAVQPIWYFNAEGVFYLCLVEYRIGRPFYGSWKLGTVAWDYFAIFVP